MTLKELTLDIGCGAAPRGDINIDLHPESTFHRGKHTKPIITPRNFIIADAQHLPIKTKSVDIAFSSHIIEHVENPVEFLKECVRVARKKVVVCCPHKFGWGAKRDPHKWSFKQTWFKQVFHKMRWPGKVWISHWRYILPFFPFFLFPDQIRVEIDLKGLKRND